ncbi:MAG: phosphoribosylanthranilate isomerase [Gemmatimonadaceae bacterium]|nr:phosphoribosylanthranilate isomerase [Gemmatimonadaceae bacterium]
MTRIKICGLTRELDVVAAVEAGAAYVGMIFAGGPREIGVEQAAAVGRKAVGQAQRVGVFGAQRVEEIARIAEAASLDVIQLHADPTPVDVRAVRVATARPVWGVLRVSGNRLPVGAPALAEAADAVVLDPKVEGQLGGSGQALAWSELSEEVDALRRLTMVVLAGGLRPENVEDAIRALRPDVVDVSSGVESAPGIKDHERVRAFARATHAAL